MPPTYPSSTTLSPAYQRSADASSLPTFILPPLEEVIRELHAVVRMPFPSVCRYVTAVSVWPQTHNAKTDGHVMVGGMGATMVIHATIIALSEQILQVGYTCEAGPIYIFGSSFHSTSRTAL